jgi:uncharacterized protein
MVREGARLAVRVVPKAATDRILGLVAEAGGASALKVAVHAPPEGGKANEALLRLLSATIHVPRTALTIALGASQRRKLVEIGGDPARLRPLIETMLAPWLRG